MYRPAVVHVTLHFVYTWCLVPRMKDECKHNTAGLTTEVFANFHLTILDMKTQKHMDLNTLINSPFNSLAWHIKAYTITCEVISRLIHHRLREHCPQYFKFLTFACLTTRSRAGPERGVLFDIPRASLYIPGHSWCQKILAL